MLFHGDSRRIAQRFTKIFYTVLYGTNYIAVASCYYVEALIYRAKALRRKV